MNKRIFVEIYSEGHADSVIWEAIIQSDKPMVAVLTLHLMCENFLEAWICAHINVPDLFKEKENSIKFSMQFQNKLKFAQRLGLPMEAYKAIDKLNSIRNNFAHKLNFNIIENSQVESIANNVNLIKSKSISHDLNREVVRTYSESGEIEKEYKFNSKSTPNTIKLAIIYGYLIRKLILDF